MLLSTMWDVVIMAEQAGVYRLNPRSYHTALEQLGVDVVDAAFVADSSYNVFGTAAVGLRTYWHNWISLTPVEGVQLPEITPPTLDDLLPWARRPVA